MSMLPCSQCPLLLHQIKLDMEMRGTILLRNTADDTVAVLQTERLEQVRWQHDRAELWGGGVWWHDIRT